MASNEQQAQIRERGDRAQLGMLWYLGAVGLLLAAGVFALVYYQLPTTEREAPPSSTAPISIVVLKFAGDSGDKLSAALHDEFSQDFTVISADSYEPGETSADQLLVLSGADAIISGEIPQVRRFQAVHAFLHDSTGRRLIWSDSLLYSSLKPYLNRVAGDIARAARPSLESRQDEMPRFFPSIETQQHYFAGRLHLDRGPTSLDIEQARTRFEAALRNAPEYAKARAGLCEALLQRGLLSGEPGLLEDAEKECERALQADPTPVEAHTAWGNLLRERGRLQEALTAFDRALKRDAYYTDAYIGLAETHARVFLTTGSDEAGEQAVARAQQAVDTYQYFWKSTHVLSGILDITGDTQSAIDAGEEAKTLQPNEQVLLRLGSLYLCQGNFSRALANYERASKSPTVSYEAKLGLGVAHYLLGEYEQAAQGLRLAVASAEQQKNPADHDLWGQLGDSLRHGGKDREALQAYQKAVELVRDGKSAGHRAYQAYYQAVVADMDPVRKTQQSKREIEAWLREVQDDAIDPAVLRRIAEAWVLARQMIRARTAYDKLRGKCPGYASAPDLLVLREGES